MAGRNAQVTGLAVDSRAVGAGMLFAALPGVRLHGASFIDTALEHGAAAILTDAEGARLARAALDASDAALVIAEDPRQTLAYAAALWFGAQPEVMVAVTGTNGKTSVATFTRQIWERMGLDAVNLGTTGVEGALSLPMTHTTPEPITLHALLAQCAEAGVGHAAMEASSHGLAQKRLDGVRLAAAGFSNITQDHLDYHADFEAYFQAKAGLFARVLHEDGVAVVNIDDPHGTRMAEIASERGQDLITVRRRPGADLHLGAQRFDATGQMLRFDWEDSAHQLRLDLIGGFQAENVLLAAGLAIGAGAEPARVFAALPEMRTVRGRMQLAATRHNGAAVFVDYAHTPDALEQSLSHIRRLTSGRIILVFGAGGDRDRAKRPLMGQVSGRADTVIITSDNPRSEDPRKIIVDIQSGLAESGRNVLCEVDRRKAIHQAVRLASSGDVVLVAGKGHEKEQIIGDELIPFDDCQVIRECLEHATPDPSPSVASSHL